MSTDWAAVYRSTFPDLVRFLHRKVWDPDQARDLAQEAFVRALSEEPTRPRPWLFRVASNLARDEARLVTRRKRHLALLKSEAEVAQSVASTPDRQMEDREASDTLRRALDALSDRDREALLLWDAGLSYPEIAEQTGLSVGAVGTTLSRARKKLVQEFEKKGESDAARG